MLHSITTEILDLFSKNGGSMYGGEEVTQIEHALQAAILAKLSGATDDLIVAALLHDIGHLLHDLPDDASDRGIDDVHEALAAQFLEAYFKPSVVEPVKLHVAAKRYLCATEAGYYDNLSTPSKTSLAFQGGIMTPTELVAFELNPFYKDAVALRRWDDLAKDPTMETPNVDYFVQAIENTLK